MNAQQETLIDEHDIYIDKLLKEMNPPRIRPSYYNDQFVGFHIEVFSLDRMDYESIGFTFETYKLTVLSLRAIETGNEPVEGSVTPVTDHYPRLKDNRKSDRIRWSLILGFSLYCAAVAVGLYLTW